MPIRRAANRNEGRIGSAPMTQPWKPSEPSARSARVSARWRAGEQLSE
jgi:hypothetical protein